MWIVSCHHLYQMGLQCLPGLLVDADYVRSEVVQITMIKSNLYLYFSRLFLQQTKRGFGKSSWTSSTKTGMGGLRWPRWVTRFRSPLSDDKSTFISNKPRATHLLQKIKTLPCDTTWVLNPYIIQSAWVGPVIQHTTISVRLLKAKNLFYWEVLSIIILSYQRPQWEKRSTFGNNAFYKCFVV